MPGKGIFTKVISKTPVGGGSINASYKLVTDTGLFFIKENKAGLYPGMFRTEADGLDILRKNSRLVIPRVIEHGQEGNTEFILMEWIESSRTSADFFTALGERIAGLHKNTSESHGLDHDNYIGSLPQSNKQHNRWTSFFIEERLEPMVKSARDSGKAGTGTSKWFEDLYDRLSDIIPEEKPSLLHGDLWSGNYLASQIGPCVIDPSVYYGFREMDLAMSRLFGGFEKQFYDAYDHFFPLEKGWEERVDICNLYPLMVHVNLFGGGYLRQVEGILKRYS